MYEENDPEFGLNLYKSADKNYIFIISESKSTTEIRYFDTNNVNGDFVLFAERQNNVEYQIEHHSGRFLILTNENAINFKLMVTPVNNHKKENWRDFILHQEDIYLTEIRPFEEFIAVFYRKDGFAKIFICDVMNYETRTIDFDEEIYTVTLEKNPEFAANTLRVLYSSLTTPSTVYEIDIKNGKKQVLKQQDVPNYDPNLYESRSIMAIASDKTLIPISLVYRKGVKFPSPTLLYGYGSYGYSMDPFFNPSRLSLLDRGIVFAIAHIRGGSEMGRKWYEDGKMLNKKNTFTDFIACAEHLITENIAQTDALAAMGGSAGGLLMGTVINMRPDLFKAVIAIVPFVDVVNTMLDPTIPLTTGEYTEWGNPNDYKYYSYIKEYSPYDNVRQTNYPHMLVETGINDPRVGYWEPAKWVAKIRANKTDDNTLLLKTDLGSGHGGPSGRFNALRELAFEYAFLIDKLNLSR